MEPLTLIQARHKLRRLLSFPPALPGMLLLCLALASSLEANSLPPLHHELHIELNPDTHTLTGVDRIHLPPQYRSNPSVSFILHPQLIIDRMAFNGHSLPMPTPSSVPEPQAPSTRRVVTLPLPPLEYQDQPDQPAVLTIDYHGVIDDSPKASGGLRFVRPDDTNGHIGPNGIYLTYETFWHPTWEHTLSTYDLTLNLPADWEAITQGQERAQTMTEGRRISEWTIALPSEALTVAANHFVVQKEQWKGIEIAAYLFPEEARLAPQYLKAAIHYLRMYTDLLGPYPFTKFAVVENFFPSGLGLPSFTLLGEGVVRRGYTQPYSLGHEIVHSWFGNSVFNEFAKGNWVEGLTTYLSNYYYDEATGNLQEAFTTRRRMVHEYNLYAAPDKEYPVRDFHHKEDRLDNAIGYQKTALVFHMLRQEIGDKAFFKGVRGIVEEGTGKYLDWTDLQWIFSEAAGRDLDWFFQQWIDRPGAPTVTLQNVFVQEDPAQKDRFILTGTIRQNSPVYNLRLPVQLDLQEGLTQKTILEVDQPVSPFSVQLEHVPTRVTIDPQHHLLLRFKRDQLPPMLNKWETDIRRILIQPQTLSEENAKSYASLFQRLEGQPGIEPIQTDDPVIDEPASYVVIGPPARRLLKADSFRNCGKVIDLKPGQVSINEQTFQGPEMAFLISCPHPQDAKHTVSFFFGESPEAVKPVARLLFFYGWDSFLVFQQGKVIARGMFEPVHSARQFTIPAQE